MSFKEQVSHKPGVHGYLRRALFVVLCVCVLIAVVQVILYVQRPRIQYSLKQSDCSSSAIAARNAAKGFESKACVLVISATNLKNTNESVDYDGVGGGPIGGSEPLIRIYNTHNKFCYVSVMGEGSSFTPHGTNELTLRCAGMDNPPKHYDEASDIDPSYIEISGLYTKVQIPIDLVR